EVVTEIREKSQGPILTLSENTADNDKSRGLAKGADDYVVKPCNPVEGFARIKYLLRRSSIAKEPHEQTGESKIGSLIINKDQHEVSTIDGESVHLTVLEFGILYLLASNPNRVFSADEIFERVWQQENAVPSKTVMVHVSHLRDKLEQVTSGEEIVKT